MKMSQDPVEKPKKNKTLTLLRNQTQAQNDVSSQRIEELLETDLKSTLRYYLKVYGPKLENTLGMTRDDLINDARFQVWKGLVTFNKEAKASLKTYLHRLLDNRFKLLLKKTTTRKENKITYYSNVWEQAVNSDDSRFSHNDTGETIFECRNAIMGDLNSLNPEDVPIYEQLLLGSSIKDMEVKLNQAAIEASLPPPYTRMQIIGAINRITLLIQKRQNS